MINNIDNKNQQENENMLLSDLNQADLNQKISDTQEEIQQVIGEDIGILKQYLRNNHPKLYILCNNLEKDLTTNIYVQLHVQPVSKQEIKDIKQKIQDRVE